MPPAPLAARRNGRVRALLDPAEFVRVFNEALAAQASPELAILHLIDKYQFDPSLLHSQITRKRLGVSFSRVSFTSIAPVVGLESDVALRDAGTFDLGRARITTALFRQIVEDIEVITKQYGPASDHQTDEARSKFIAPLFNRLVAQFNLLITNTPGSIIQGHITQHGRIQSYFKVFGVVTLIFVQARINGTATERLDTIAQIISEADGQDINSPTLKAAVDDSTATIACALVNHHYGFSVPIHAILSDGVSFESFRYESNHDPPKLLRAAISPPSGAGPRIFKSNIADLYAVGAKGFMLSLRPICETIFFLLLEGYKVGLTAYREKFERRSISMSQLDQCRNYLTTAQTYAVQGASVGRPISSADSDAVNAVNHLSASINQAPAAYKRNDCDLLSMWDNNNMG